MTKLYTFAFMFGLVLFLSGCKKERYAERIIGTWELVDVDRVGGGSTGSLPFRDGRFTFEESGGLTYIASNGDVYSGNWDMDRKNIQGNCYTDDDGYTNCENRVARTLQVSMANFSTQDVLSEYFDEIIFSSNNRFRAVIYGTTRIFRFDFRRR